MSIIARQINMGIKFQREFFSEMYYEMAPLNELHHAEINLFGDPLDVDINTYIQCETDGIFRLYSMRIDNELVGYSGFFIYHHPHHAKIKHASQDVLFIRQDKRGHGTIFIRYCEGELKKLGVDVVLQHVPKINDWSKVLERMDYTELETTYFRRI